MSCPNCQTANPDTAKFCLNCGFHLEPAQPVEGERRIVTVLFADVVGSTAMAERLDPEQITEIMNGAFSFLNSTVAAYGGTVSRILGDAILAFFGAPTAHEDDAERAIRASLEIRESTRTYAQLVKATYGVEFNLRLGLNTGLVVIAVVGDQVRAEYTVMGDTVNVAARLQEVADPGSVLVSAETYRLVKHLFDVKPRGSFALKGKSLPVETFEILGPKAEHGTGRGLEGVRSPMVGRDSEVALLRELLEQTRLGEGGLVAITGEAGLGKSRLVSEIRSVVRSDSSDALQWLEGRALSYQQRMPYYPWREIIRQSVGAHDGDSPADIREKLQTAIDHDGQMQDSVPFLEAILAVQSDESVRATADLDGEVVARGITASVTGFVRSLVAQGPLIIAIDDLQWADQASLELLLKIADEMRDERLRLITMLRPEKDAPSWSFVEQARDLLGERFHQISLEPLDAAHSGELLGNLLYIEDLPGTIHDAILKKSDGNPFFLEEIIRSLIDSGHIVRENSHWRATREIHDVTLPDTLVGVLSARIDRLPDDTKRVAQLAAIIGRIFEYRVLKAVCETAPPGERVIDPLPELVRLTYEELVRERAQYPELEFIFKHVLTQETAYNLLLVRTRRQYHRRVAAVLEEMYNDRLDEHAAVLAYHWWQGEDWLHASDYSLRAATRAERKLFALREAHEHYMRAYQSLERLPDPPPERLCDLILVWTPSALKFQPHEEVLSRLERAETIARERGDKYRLSQVLHWIAHVHVWDGFSSRAIPALIENYELAKELDDERLRVYPAWFMAFELVDSDPRAALEQLEQVADMAHRYHNREIEAHTLSSMALAHARLGQVSHALEYLRRGHEAIQGLDAPVTEADVYLISSLVYFDLDDMERGLEFGRLGTEKALESRALECAGAGYCFIGLGNLQMRKPLEALRTFEESLKFSEGVQGEEKLVNQVLAGIAIASYNSGKSEALDDMVSNLRSSQALGNEYTAAMVSLALGEAYMGLERFESASECLDSAMDYYQRTGMRPYIVRVLHAQSDLYEKQGRLDDAREARIQAERILDQMHSGSTAVNNSGAPGLETHQST